MVYNSASVMKCDLTIHKRACNSIKIHPAVKRKLDFKGMLLAIVVDLQTLSLIRTGLSSCSDSVPLVCPSTLLPDFKLINILI